MDQARQFERYTMQWARLSGYKHKPPSSLLTFSQIPWPVFDPPPRQPSDITPDRIEQFLFHPDRPVLGETKRIRMDELRRWHPDKFEANIKSHISPEHMSMIKEATLIVCQALT